jgi:hypothetical protein
MSGAGKLRRKTWARTPVTRTNAIKASATKAGTDARRGGKVKGRSRGTR